jgi:N-acetyl-beta-hexosaminidase
VRAPGPKTSVTGKVVTSEDGEPLPDKSVRDAARNTILKTVRTRMDLLGLAAPRKSMSLQASVELDSENESLQAQLAEAYSAALADKERELADLRAELESARSSGPPALTMVTGRAEGL